jgi:type III pantothenate kinase
MLLLIDIGNTSITLGFCRNGDIIDKLSLETIREGRGIGEYSGLLDNVFADRQIEKPDDAAICSVVPEITPFIEDAVKKNFGIEPLTLNSRTKTGLTFSIKNLETLGMDRVANAVAARKLYKGHLIIVDFGTATTFDFGTATTFCVVTEKGEYMGGAIMPGPGLSANSLAEKTARLPGVELKSPVNIIGRDTSENILTGIVLGHAGAVERIVREISKELKLEPVLIATGGFAHLIAPHIKEITHINPLLTLEGIRLIYEMNL